MTILDKIGFMQGRLSPIVKNKIQAFPWKYWEDEFIIAKDIGITLMEWTLDHEDIFINPLLTEPGHQKIRDLCGKYSLGIPSITADFIMQMPYYKYEGEQQKELLNIFRQVLASCGNLGIQILVFPIVDDGRINNYSENKALLTGLDSSIESIEKANLKICFESDLPPVKLKEFINCFDPRWFGINYDIGNSASLGFDPIQEIGEYGNRIVNVHVKDRILGGTTVALGNGAADFTTVFNVLRSIEYDGNYILQTARAENNDHTGTLLKYKNMVSHWLDSTKNYFNESQISK